MKQRLASFWSDDRGAIAATYAMSLIGLVAVAGVAFDYSRLAGLDSELQNAADQAALAGATQLDRAPGACARAANAAIGMLSNVTLLANDGETNAITVNGDVAGISGSDACGDIDGVVFYTTADGTTVADTDADARFIEVIVDERSGNYAFTPIVGAVFPDLAAAARAGLGSSVCKVPPIMICSPDPSKPFNANANIGDGIMATGHNPAGNTQGPKDKADDAGGDEIDPENAGTWSPGNFGFLQVNDASATSRNSKLLVALAYSNPPIDCTPIDGNRVSPGNPQRLYDAINTRFDIYDFNDNGNNVLAACQGGACPSAPNVIKDFLNKDPSKNNACNLGNGKNGWHLPDELREFKPVPRSPLNGDTLLDDNEVIDIMGLPRDNCHYTSFNETGLCAGDEWGRFGNGQWARADYFKTNHPSIKPSNWTTITRYQTYLWELAAAGSRIPNGGTSSQWGIPACFKGAVPGGPERRVMTVAVVSNCEELAGSSREVKIDEWVDVFLVEPSIDAKVRHNAFKDAIYMEIIGKSRVAGSGTYGTQNVRRDVPYLVR